MDWVLPAFVKRTVNTLLPLIESVSSYSRTDVRVHQSVYKVYEGIVRGKSLGERGERVTFAREKGVTS